MSFYGHRALSGSRGMGTFSAFGGGGRPIWGPFSFAESWSSDDFDSASQFNSAVKPYLDQVSRKDLTFDPLTSAVRTKAASAWAAWKAASDMGSPTADSFISTITAQMNDLISRADSLSLTGSLGHRSEGNEVARYDVFNQIIAVAKKVANSAAQAQSASDAAIAAGAVLPTPATTAGTGNKNSSMVTSDTTSGGLGVNQGAATAAPTDNNTLLYVGLGVGALVLIGGAVVMRRKSQASAAVAGYHRRKRKSRRRSRR